MVVMFDVEVAAPTSLRKASGQHPFMLYRDCLVLLWLCVACACR